MSKNYEYKHDAWLQICFFWGVHQKNCYRQTIVLLSRSPLIENLTVRAKSSNCVGYLPISYTLIADFVGSECPSANLNWKLEFALYNFGASLADSEGRGFCSHAITLCSGIEITSQWVLMERGDLPLRSLHWGWSSSWCYRPAGPHWPCSTWRRTWARGVGLLSW